MVRRVLIDADAKNEIDDQYAIVRALIAPELRVEALTAAGFHDRVNGARLSYEEEQRLLELMGLEGTLPVALGSALPMEDRHTPRRTEAAELIIERAMADADGPLYVLGLGQFTNLASALLIEPRIKERVVFACIDGDYRHGGKPAWGKGCYNWPNDPAAVRTILESDVPYIHMPAPSVSRHMRAERRVVAGELSGKAPVYDYLVSLWPEDQETRVLWDVALVHVMIDPGHGEHVDVPAPTVHADGSTTDAPDNPRRVRVHTRIDRDAIYQSYWASVEAALAAGDS